MGKRYIVNKVKPGSKLDQMIQNQCWSIWEGCCCGASKGHFGKHVCAAKGCDCRWTDEQADEWHKKEIEPLLKKK